MLFSIIVPVYNGEKYLRECLDSIVSQDFNDYELIIIDNASVDNSISIIYEYCQKYAFIKLLQNKENKGLLQSRITAAENALGDYLMFIDADDYLLNNNKVLSLLSRTVKKSRADIIQYGIKANESWGNWFEPIFEGLLTDQQKIRSLFFTDDMHCAALWSRLIKRELYLSMVQLLPAGLHVTMTEDFLQMSLLMYRAQSYYGMKKKLYGYRNHSEGVQQSFNVSKQIENFKTVKTILDILSAHLPPEEWTKVKDLLAWHSYTVISAYEKPLKTSDNLLGWMAEIFGGEYIIKKIFSSDPQRQAFLLSRFKLDFAELISQTPKKRIGFVVHDMFCGGAEKAHAILLNEFQKRGYTVILFTDAPPNERDFAYSGSIKRVTLSANSEDLFEKWSEMVTLYDLDVFFVYDNELSNTYAHMLCLKLLKQRVVVMCHTDFFINSELNSKQHQNFVWSVRMSIYPTVDAICTLIPYNAAYLSLSGIDRAVLVNNPLPLFPDILPSIKEDLLILWIGRFQLGKQPMDALWAFMKARPCLPKNTKLVMLGDGYYKQEILDFINNYNLQDYVELPGFVDPLPYYKKASLHIMTSQTEAWSLVIAETKMFGIPTLMFELPDIVFSGTDGIIAVPQNDKDALAESLKWLLNDSQLLMELGQKARQSINDFDTDHIMNRWENIINAVAENTLTCNPDFIISPTIEDASKILKKINKYVISNSVQDYRRGKFFRVLERLNCLYDRIFPPGSRLKKIMYALYCEMHKIYDIFKRFLFRNGGK